MFNTRRMDKLEFKIQNSFDKVSKNFTICEDNFQTIKRNIENLNNRIIELEQKCSCSKKKR
jgi:hypothetical protein